MMKMINVLLADDHHVVREGLKMLLNAHQEVAVIGEADNGRRILELLKTLLPDVVVMDITMPELNGIDSTARIKKEYPSVKVLGLSMHMDRRFIEGMLKAGASGYLLKSCIVTELVTAIKCVADGDTYLSPKIAGKIVERVLKQPMDHGRDAMPDSPELDRLTSREREILQLIAEGGETKEIAFNLLLSPKTVEAHRRNIMEKLNIYNVAMLTRYAIREGLTCLEV
jgi:DNA-binding NarL/FixJ family response regulator